MKFASLLLLLFISLSSSTPEFSLIVLKKPPQELTRAKAFKVLAMKCNTCHATKKRTDIFTLENMDSLALEINRQVFVKKKMPKGRKNNLTEQESQALQDWLNSFLE